MKLKHFNVSLFLLIALFLAGLGFLSHARADIVPICGEGPCGGEDRGCPNGAGNPPRCDDNLPGDPGPIYCGDNSCDSSLGENSNTCPYDCPSSPPVCGDSQCNAGSETTYSCPADCGTPGPTPTAPDVDIQLGDAGRSSPSHPGDCANKLSGIGKYVSTSGDADCERIRLNNPGTYNQNFRLCITAGGGTSCTPWASEGGGAGNVAIGGDAIRSSSVSIQTSGAPSVPSGTTFSNVSVGTQLFYRSNGSACGASAGAAYSSSTTMSSWTYGAYNDDDPGCIQAHLNVTSAFSPMSGTLSSSNCTISQGASTCNSSINWNTTNPQGTSSVTTPPNITVGTGNSGSTSYPIPYGSTDFYLYNNNTQLSQSSATATCAGGTAFNNGVCAPISGGSCGATHYTCNAGTSINNSENSPTNWTWTCTGVNGGANTSCSEPIPVATNLTGACPSPGTSAAFSWNLPSGYSLSYFRVQDLTTGTYPAAWIPENVADTGPSTFFSTTPGHTYNAWVHTRLPSGGYSNAISSQVTCSVPTNGICAATHYSCTAGTSANNATAAPNWTWTCNSPNGGTNASCSETVPMPTNLVLSCPSPGSTVNASWTAPAGYNTFYLRADSPDAWLWPPNAAQQDNVVGVSSSFASTSGQTYGVWIYTKAPSDGNWSDPLHGTITCSTGTSDLTASAVGPNSATTNVAQTYTAIISNVDAGATGASFPYFFQTATAAGGGGTVTDRSSSTMSALASGGNATATSPSITFPSAGTYSIRVCADKTSSAGGGVITESNEGNNCGAWTDVTVSANNTAPVGWLDAASCSSIDGWAVDQDTSSSSINVRVYDGPSSGGNLLGTILANVSRPDVNAYLGITGNHGYSFITPASVKNNANHSIYVYGVDSSSGSDSGLAGVPQTINCSPPSCATMSPNVSIYEGASTTITWQAPCAAVCNSINSNFNTGGAPSGSLSVTPFSTTTYSIQCTDPAASVASTTVTVKKKPVIIEN